MAATYNYQPEAQAAFDARDFEKALGFYCDAFREAPTNADILNDRAVCLFHLNRKTEALSDLDQAVKLQPDYGYRYASRAYLRSSLKDLEGALADYQKAIELDPEDAISHNNMGLLEEQMGYVQSAKQRFDQADAINDLLSKTGVGPQELPPEIAESKTTLSEPEPEVTEPPASTWKEVTKVFTEKEQRRSFWKFLKGGMRLPKDS